MRCMQVVATAGNSVFSLLLVLAVLLECASGFGPAVPTARVFTSWLERNRSPRRFTLRGGTADETSMSSAPNEPLVSCEWLKENLDKVKVLDASWYLPFMERSATGEFEKQRIPGAAFFDIDKICDLSSPHPHMMPSKEFFAERVGMLKVKRDDHVVVYDGKGLFSAPRAWTMFQLFGHAKVHILDGGFPAWLAAGFDVETSPKSAEGVSTDKVEYGDASGPADVMTLEEVQENLASNRYQLVDARSFARFIGEAPEPRPIESGHIEGSYCVPFVDVLTPEGTMKGAEDIKAIFNKQKIDLRKPVAVTCGSGVSACVIRAALFKAGILQVPLYDGAYTEWKVSGYPTFKGTDKSPYAE